MFITKSKMSSEIIASSPFKKEGLKFPTPQQFYDSCQPQRLLPYRKPIIDYILTTVKSQKLYLNLIKSCKLFFLKNPVLLITELNYTVATSGEKWYYSTGKGLFCDFEELNVKNLMAKLWVTENLRVVNTRTGGFTKLYPLLYQCDATYLSLMTIKIGLADLKFMSKCVTKIHITDANIIDENGKTLLLEDLLEGFSGAESFSINRSSNNQVKDYAKLVHACSTISYLGIHDLQHDFDVGNFVKILEETKCPANIYYQRQSDNQVYYYEGTKKPKEFSDDSSDDTDDEDTEMSDPSNDEDMDLDESSNIEDSELSESSNIVESESDSDFSM